MLAIANAGDPGQWLGGRWLALKCFQNDDSAAGKLLGCRVSDSRLANQVLLLQNLDAATSNLPGDASISAHRLCEEVDWRIGEITFDFAKS